ncbi:unnamed protein product, partial [Amoebophrya sp. A120]|eukprot:GSA120T00010805001.1
MSVEQLHPPYVVLEMIMTLFVRKKGCTQSVLRDGR